MILILQSGYAVQYFLSMPLFHIIIVQTQKVTPARDFTSDRLQYRAGGRQSSGPDARRASLTSFAGESEDRKSRESTPRLGPTPGPSTGPPIRRRRKYYLVPSQLLFLTLIFFQLLHWISLTAHPYTSSLMARKRYAHHCDFYPNHILSLKRLLFASMHEGEASYGGVKLETWLKLMLISSVGFGISLFNPDISR